MLTLQRPRMGSSQPSDGNLPLGCTCFMSILQNIFSPISRAGLTCDQTKFKIRRIFPSSMPPPPTHPRDRLYLVVTIPGG